MKLNSIAAKAVLSLLMVTLFSYAAHTQAITKSASIPYTNGVPTHTPSSVGSEIAINTVNKDFYFWNGSAWVKIVFGAGGNIAYTDVANTFTQNQIFTLPTLTGSSATNGLSITQTWNTTGSPKLIFANVTPTALGSSNSLIDLQVAGVSKFRVSAGTSTTTNPSSFIIDQNGWVQVQSRAGSTSGNMFDIGSPIISTITTGTQAGLGVTYPVIFPNAGNANFRPIQVLYTINAQGAQTGTATGIFLNATETALNGMAHNLMDLQMGGTSRFRVTNTGDAYVSAGIFRGSNQVLFTVSGNESLTLRDNVGAVRVSLSTVNNSYLTGGNLLLGTNTGTTANLNIATPSAVSYSAILTSGTWFTGGTSTTTKPHVLIEPSGTTSTNWSANGTGLGINAASGFGGNLLDLQLNGVSKLIVTSAGALTTTGGQNSIFGGNVIAGFNFILPASNILQWSGSSKMNASLDGTILITNNAATDFQRLQFGGTTSSFPALQTASSNAQTGLAATFTNGSANIGTATNTYAVNDVVRFTTTGALPTGFVAGTLYYVIATDLTATNIQVSATSGGSAITAGSGGSGTHTLTRVNVCTFITSNTTITTSQPHGLQVGDVVRFGTTGSFPSGLSGTADYYVLTIPSTTTLTVSVNFGGAAFVPASTGTGIIPITRSPGLYVRTADNSATSALYAGNIVGNAPTGYTGRVFDLRVGTTTVLNVDQVGNTIIGGGLTTTGGIVAGSTQSLAFSLRSVLRSSLDGDFSVTNNAGTGFGMFKLGGNTSSFPAIKRNGATIETVLADDSGFAAEQSLYLRFGAGSPEGVVTAPVGAFYSRTDGGAGTSFYVKESGTGSTGWVAK